jgi:hypothetical protein
LEAHLEATWWQGKPKSVISGSLLASRTISDVKKKPSYNNLDKTFFFTEPIMSEPEDLDPEKLRPGPIRNESLPIELLDQIKGVFDLTGPYIGMTMDQFEIGFMRDMQPEREVALWCNITAAWLAYHGEFLIEDSHTDEEEKELLGALIAISTGVDDVSKLGVPAEVGQRLLECYDDMGKVA